MKHITIRAFSQKDLPAVTALQPKGWDDITAMFQFYDSAPFCFPIVAVQSRHIAAIGASIVFGHSGWLAHLIVDPAYRRRGLGKQMTMSLVAMNKDLGCTSQSLIATAMGEPIYTACGFRPCSRYCFFEGPKLPTPPTNTGLKPLSPADLPEVLAMDYRLSGEDRRPLLEALIRTGWLFRDPGTHVLRGYYLPDLREGTILADDPVAGLTLLDLKHHLKKGISAIPESNETARTHLMSHGFSELNAAQRMVLGPDVPWHPTAVYSRIAGFCP